MTSIWTQHVSGPEFTLFYLHISRLFVRVNCKSWVRKTTFTLAAEIETHCVPPDSFEKNKKDLSYFAYFLPQLVIMCLLKRVLCTAAFNTLHV